MICNYCRKHHINELFEKYCSLRPERKIVMEMMYGELALNTKYQVSDCVEFLLDNKKETGIILWVSSQGGMRYFVSSTDEQSVPALLQGLPAFCIEEESIIRLIAVPKAKKVSVLNNNEKYLTVAEVAQELRIGVEQVRRYIRTKQLRSLPLGGKYHRIKRSDLDEFVGAHKA